MKTTNDLMDTLTRNIDNKDELDTYIDDISKYSDINLVDYFTERMKAHNVKKNELVRKSNISRTYTYQILNGTRNPGRDNLIALCIAAGFTLEETIRCLEISKLGTLYPKDARDSIIIYSINHQMSLADANNLLFNKNLRVLNQTE